MSYGLQLNFDGYPTINTDNLVSLYPLGTYFESSFYQNSTSRGFSGTHPRSAPNGAGLFATVASHGLRTLVESIGISNTGLSGLIYGRGTNGAGITTWADCRNLASNDAYGIVFKDKGVDTALAHGGVGAMRVVARRTYSIPSSNYVYSSVSLSVPELQQDLRGYKDLVVFVGVRTRSYTPIATYTPINSFASGANITVSFISSGISNGAQLDETNSNSFGNNRPAMTLYLMVCAAPTPTIGNEYGIAVYNKSGNISMSQNNVPVFCKGTFNTMALSSTPRGWIGTQSVPTNLQNTDLIMLPVGGNTKGIMSHVTSSGDTWKTGRQIFFFSGNTIKSAFGYNSSAYVPTNSSGGYLLYTSFMPSNTTFMSNPTPVAMLDGNDYFL